MTRLRAPRWATFTTATMSVSRSAREEMPVTYTGQPMTVAFNPEFWLDALKTLDVAEVTVELSGPDRPAVIRQPGFTYLVLPMKVS